MGYGDGIYAVTMTAYTGKIWAEELRAISRIITHPTNSDIVWVAVQGPMWTKGVIADWYKTIDGGKTWKKTLGDNEWVGSN